MKSNLLAGIALGIMIGAVSVSLCKPAQTFVRKSADAVKEEAKSMINKATKQN